MTYPAVIFPWENPAMTDRRQANPEDVHTLTGTAPQLQSTATSSSAMYPAAPPIPARPHQRNSQPLIQPPAHGYGMYGGYGPYSPYAGMSSGYMSGTAGVSPYSTGPMEPGLESWFIQTAEESSRGAFQSIESFVRVFTSVSQMLESTYVLIHSSFRAVVGVAEHVGRMRLHLSHLLSALSLVRVFRWAVRFVRRWLGMSDPTAAAESVWKEQLRTLPSSAAADGVSSSPPHSHWPVLAYFTLVIGAPYLIYRLLQTKRHDAAASTDGWTRGEGEHYRAVSSYDFVAESGGELSMRAGDQLLLAPRQLQPVGVRGWVLAANSSASGLVPANRVRIVKHVTAPRTAAQQLGTGAVVQVPHVPAGTGAGVQVPHVPAGTGAGVQVQDVPAGTGAGVQVSNVPAGTGAGVQVPHIPTGTGGGIQVLHVPTSSGEAVLEVDSDVGTAGVCTSSVC